jgi:hypothetical protein
MSKRTVYRPGRAPATLAELSQPLTRDVQAPIATASEHAQADAACGRAWVCACGACRQVRALLPADAPPLSVHLPNPGCVCATCNDFRDRWRSMVVTMGAKGGAAGRGKAKTRTKTQYRAMAKASAAARRRKRDAAGKE